MALAVSIACLVMHAGSFRADAQELERFVDDADVVLIDGRTVQMGLDDEGVARMSEACRATGDTRCGPERFDRERGDLEVVVDPFIIDYSEISRQRYYQCIEQGACEPVDERACRLWDGEAWSSGQPIAIVGGIERVPVTCVTLAEAEAYCRWAGVRLPTEAEWAAAAGVGSRVFPWGNEFTGNEANYRDVVGRLENAARGRGWSRWRSAAHLAGNAYEWVADGHPCPFGETCTDSDQAVIRGGSYLSSPGSLRSTYRRFVSPETRSGDLGFRCAADYAESPDWALPPATEPIPTPADTAPTSSSRVVGISHNRFVLTDLDSGEQQTLHRTSTEIRSIGRDSADTIGFSVLNHRGGVDHYVWAQGAPRPTPVVLPEPCQSESEASEQGCAFWFDRTAVMTNDDEGLCIATYYNPVEEDGPRRYTDGVRVVADGTVTRMSGECTEAFGLPLELCRAELSPFEVDLAAGTVAVRDDQGEEQVIFRVAPGPNLINLDATSSCLSTHTIVHWSEHGFDRILSRLVVLDSDARVVVRSRRAYRRDDRQDALSMPAWWSPDRRYLVWSDERGWFAYDFERAPQKVSRSYVYPPLYLESGVDFRWPSASESAGQPPDGVPAAELGTPLATIAPITTDEAGTRWVTLPGPDPVALFPMVDRPAESSCVEAFGPPATPVWIVSTDPKIALAWTFPPRFYQRDGCLHAWPAIPEPAAVEVEPAAAHGISYEGEPIHDCWESENLVLQHDFLPSPGLETLRYEDHQLTLSDTSGEVLSTIPLQPPYSSNWEPCNEWGHFVQVAPAEWRLEVIHDSASDSTGHDGSYVTHFIVSIGADDLRVVDMSYVGMDTYDREEITDALAARMVSWDYNEAVEGSPCWLDPALSDPDSLGRSFNLADDSSAFRRDLSYATPAGHLIGERRQAESTLDELLWPNTACGYRARNESVQVRWVLQRESDQIVVVEQVSSDTGVIGLAFGGR